MTGEPIVAMCSVGELFGGVERHLLGMCEWFLRKDTKPILVLFHDRELATQARALGFDPIIIQNKGSFDLAVPKQLAELLRHRKVNLLHAHGYRAMVNAAFARRYYHFSVVRTVHGLVEPAPLFSMQWIKSHLYNWLEETSSSLVQATVCYVTEDLRRRRSAGDSKNTSLTVHNGIDPLNPNDYHHPMELNKELFNFAAVGRISPVKDLETILRAMEKIDPTINAVLNIIGTGPSLDSLIDLAEELRLGQRVRFLGFKENIYNYLAHVDVLVMPSLHEGLPYTILETMSLGIPIIASRVGGLAEVLLDRETALLVEPSNVREWVLAMTKLASNQKLSSTLGRAAAAEQSQAFTLKTMGSDYWNVYLKILGN